MLLFKVKQRQSISHTLISFNETSQDRFCTSPLQPPYALGGHVRTCVEVCIEMRLCKHTCGYEQVCTGLCGWMCAIHACGYEFVGSHALYIWVKFKIKKKKGKNEDCRKKP